MAGSPFHQVPTPLLIQQIEGYQKSKIKLPLWHKTPHCVFPPKLSLEQCSSQITAHYKAQIVNGETLVDLTGGFGVDTLLLADNFKQVTYFEKDIHLKNISQHNASVLNRNNIQFFEGDGLIGIENKIFDVIYIDPARRHNTKGKVFLLKDCEPNLLQHLNFLKERCKTLLIKTSPMLDLQAGINDLPQLKEIHIVGINNEVKELLWIIDFNNNTTSPKIYTINFNKNNTEKYSFYLNTPVQENYSNPKKFLFEPNATVMKSCAFTNLCDDFKIAKLAKHSHLYTAEDLIDFPGRTFKIETVLPYKKQLLKGNLPKKANITIRNFKETVAQLKSRWKINDGGDYYLFFTTLQSGEKVVLFCKKIEDI